MEKIYLDIDGTDFTADYGLTVSKGTIESFLTYPQFKKPKQNDWAEYDGIEIDLSAPVFKNRTIMLNVTCRTACFNELIDTLTDGVYHDITFEPFGLEFSYCRYTSVSKVSKLNDMVDATINITIDDVPFDNYIPAVPSTRGYTGEYNLEGKSFEWYGVKVLGGTKQSIISPAKSKTLQSKDISIVDSVIYDNGAVVNMSNRTISLNCLIHASTTAIAISQLTYFMYVLTRPYAKSFTCTSIGLSSNVYYNSMKVTEFMPGWIKFTLNIDTI